MSRKNSFINIGVGKFDQNPLKWLGNLSDIGWEKGWEFYQYLLLGTLIMVQTEFCLLVVVGHLHSGPFRLNSVSTCSCGTSTLCRVPSG